MEKLVTVHNIKMTEKEAKIFGEFTIMEPGKAIVKNPFSGVEVELPPEAVAIYDIMRGCEVSLYLGHIIISRDGIAKNEDISDLFDAARDVFRRNWPEEYMLLID